MDASYRSISVLSEAAQTLKDEAELKFKSQDYTSALKYAQLAKSLDPNLQGIEQFIAAYSVHVAHAAPSAYFSHPMRKFNGEKNWYDVLGLKEFWIETKVVRQQCKKMEELVHPDKNNSIAAEGALKLINEAWSFLSNPYRRIAYNAGLDPDLQDEYLFNRRVSAYKARLDQDLQDEDHFNSIVS